MVTLLAATAGRRSFRSLALVGTALGSVVGIASGAAAQNVTYNGPGPYMLTRTDTISGGPRTVDITSTNGDITLDLATVNVQNDGTARGAGIAATETGAGKVSIKSGTVNATGTDPTTAIDARSTTGAILVNSGTVSATSTNSTALQANSSSGGAVTINADSTTGGLRGIFTGFSGGVTTITSNFATANGVNTPNAIIGQGSTVVVNSKTATLTGTGGNQGTAIFVQAGAGGATITSGTASTQGYGQVGVYLGYSAGTGAIDSGTVTTVGDYARGIYSSTVGNETIKSTTVNTSGANATGIYISPTSSTDGTASALGNVMVTSDAITTTGANSDGILLSRITAQGQTNASTLTGAINITSNTISATGANAAGIRLADATGTTSSLIKSNKITTGGGNGMDLASGVSSVSIASTSIAGAGVGINAPGINGTFTLISGDIGLTTAAGASNVGGINVTSTGSADISSGTITGSTANQNYGIFAQTTAAPSTLSIKSGSVISNGDRTGIRAITNAGALTVNSTGTITTKAATGTNGANTAVGLYATSNTGPITITSANISTTGNYAVGIQAFEQTAGSTGAVSVTSTGALNTAGNYANGIYVAPANGNATIANSGTIKTIGDNASAVLVSAQNSTGATTITNTGSVSTGGVGSYGLFANASGSGGGSVAITSNVVRTAGQNGTGIFGITAAGANSLTSTDMATTGSNAIGILGQTAGGALTIRSGAVATSGTNSAGISASTTGGAVSVTSANLSTTGNSSTGINVQQSSGAGAITVASTGALSTAGTSSHGIFVGPGAGAAAINNSGAINTSGNGAAGVFVGNATGPTTITNTGSIGTSNANAFGVYVTGTTGATTVNSTGKIVTSGANGQGINVNSTTGAQTVTSSNVTTTGLGSIGIMLRSTTGPITVTSDTVTTTGNDASAIYAFASAGGNVAVTAGTTTASGGQTNSFNYAILAQSSASNGANGTVNVQSGYASAVTNSAIQAAAGGAVNVTSNVATSSGANAIITNSSRGDVLVNATTTTLTRSPGGFTQTGALIATAALGNVAVSAGSVGAENGAGIVATSGGATSITANSVAGRGNGFAGLSATAGTSLALAIGTASSDGALTTDSSGVIRRADAVLGRTSGGPINATIATASTQGANADAINLAATGAGGITVNLSGSATATGAGGRALTAQTANGDIAITAATATTTGAYNPTSGSSSDAVTAFTSGTGAITINAGTTSAIGQYASAIFAQGGGAVTITSGTASTAGADTDAIGAVSRNGDVVINATTTTATGGGGGEGVAAVATAGNATVNLDTATSAASRGVTVSAGQLASATIGTVSGGGDGASGITLTGGTGGVLNIGSATSSGTATSSTNARTGVVTVRRADAVFATATNGTILANIGSATATGAGSDAVRLIANGTGGAVTANITGAVASTSGTGLFIDPPGANTITVAAGASVTGGLNGINATGASNRITNLGTISSSTGAGIIAAGQTTLDNSGVISGANGIAVQLGAADDTVILRTGSAITGAIAGGGGNDAAILNGTGLTASSAQTMPGFTGFSTLTVQNGDWTAPAASASSFATSATVNAGSTLDAVNGAAGLSVTVPTIIDNGALIVRSTANSAGSTFGTGVITGNGTLLFTGAGTAMLTGTNVIQSTGTVTIDGGTTVLLTGSTGGTFVTGPAGTLQIGNGGTTGNFTGSLADNGTLLVNRSDAYTFAGPLTGAGNIVKQGAGQLVFGSGYAFTGVTTIQGGSVRLTTPVAANTELDLEGSGQLDLSGTTQRVAELAGASPTASLNIAGGSLTVVQNTNTVFAGSIVGAGTFTKSGTGRLNFTGVSTYAGPTTINGGTLAVNGSIVSAVNVVAGGTLGGNGSVGTVTIGSGGTYAPGNSIGTQTVNGNVTFAAGSTFAVEANAAGQADRVNATGTATLQGGTVAVAPAPGAYANLTNYTILTAAGGVTGNFGAATSSDPTLSPFLAYGANAVTLSLARNNVVFTTMGVNPNQVGVGAAVTALGVNSPIYRGLLPLSAGAVPGALGQLSGELYASLPAVLADGSKQVREAVLARATAQGEGFGLWATGTRTLAGSRNQAGIAPVISNRWTAIGGVDFSLSGLRLGVDGGYIEDQTRVRSLGSHAKTRTTLIGGHVGFAQGPFSFVIGGDYAWHKISADRALGTAGFPSTLTTGAKAHTTQGYGEVGYGATMGNLTLTPFARFSYVHIVSDALTESGGLGALTAARDTRNYKFGSLGLRMTGDAPISENVTFQPRISAAYTHGWDVGGSRTLAFAGTGASFTETGAALARNAFDVNAGFDLAFAHRLTIGVGGFGSTSKEWSDYGAKASIGLKF